MFCKHQKIEIKINILPLFDDGKTMDGMKENEEKLPLTHSIPNQHQMNSPLLIASQTTSIL